MKVDFDTNDHPFYFFESSTLDLAHNQESTAIKKLQFQNLSSILKDFFQIEKLVFSVIPSVGKINIYTK